MNAPAPNKSAQKRAICKQCGESFTYKYGAGFFCKRACFREADKEGKTRPKGRVNGEADFWKKVDRRGGEDSCWLWQGTTDKKGYGIMTFRYRLMRMHRYSWELVHGSPSPGDCVLHHCDVPGCVNPKHLWLGTNADNVADMVKKGRQTKGAQIYNAKLNEELVCEIRWLANVCLVSYAVLGRFYGVSKGSIRAVANGKSWAYVK